MNGKRNGLARRHDGMERNENVTVFLTPTVSLPGGMQIRHLAIKTGIDLVFVDGCYIGAACNYSMGIAPGGGGGG